MAPIAGQRTFRLAAAVLLAVAVACVAAFHGEATVLAAAKAPRTDAPKSRKSTSKARAKRARHAANRPLFSSDEVLEFTLLADFKAINHDRDPNSTKTFPGTLVLAGENGDEQRLDVQLRTRGHARRNFATCSFAPLRLEFAASPAGTIFEGHKALKLGTHCRDTDTYAQYVEREYLVYRAFNLLTPRSFRARLASATYVDAASGKPLTTRPGLFLEDDDDVAKRLEGATTELQGLGFASVDAEAMTLVSLFEYMIGNTDVSLFKLHNIKLVRNSTGVVYPVPYDFDYSGLVNTHYALAAKEFGLSSVRERLYLGPCRSVDDLEPLLARFRAAREPILALYDAQPDLGDRYRKEATGYLDEFFHTIERPADAKRALVDPCRKRLTM